MQDQLNAIEEHTEESMDNLLSMENIHPVDVEEMYENMLEEMYGEIEVCGLSYNAASVLREIDITAYNCGLSDYIDSLLGGDNIVEINGDYYDFWEISEFIDKYEDMLDDE